LNDSLDEIVKNFNQIKKSYFEDNGPENWAHEITQLLVRAGKYKKCCGTTPLGPEQMEFLKTSLTTLERKEGQKHEQSIPGQATTV